MLKHSEEIRNWCRKNPMQWKIIHDKANRKYMKNHLEKVRKIKRLWNINNLQKKKADNANRYLSLGLECELCPDDDARTNDLEHHHLDYDYPKITITVCRECHALQRREN